MKLSEAIILGSTLHPQGFGQHFDGKATCAFGAAGMAINSARGGMHDWPWTSEPGTCPVCHERTYHIATVISMHLNDWHKWTRERIADWVATIEPQESTPELASLTAPLETALPVQG